jgi:chromosomal replication initiator protein
MLPKWYVPPHLRARRKRSGSAVINAVLREFSISKDLLKSNSRARHIVRPRQVAWYVMSRNCPHLSYPMMAQMLGRIDHSTVIHGVDVVSSLVACDVEFALRVERVEMAVVGG